MAMYLLDTDAVIDFVAGIPSSVALIEGIVADGDILCVSDIVVTEVHSGLTPEDAGKSEGFVRACSYLPTSYDVARQAGRWRYEYRRRGVTLALSDALIAATAHSHGATVVTANLKDYPMPEVSVLPLPRSKR